MSKKSDTFWKWFFIVFSAILIVQITYSYYAYSFLPKKGTGTIYDSYTVSSAGSSTLEDTISEYAFVETPYIYRDSFTYGWDVSTFNTDLDTEAINTVGGTPFISMGFLGTSSDVTLSVPHLDTSLYRSLKFSILDVDAIADDVLLSFGTSTDFDNRFEQSIGWYVTGTNKIWKEVTIPLENLHVANTVVHDLTFSSDKIGTVYIDNIRLSTEPYSFRIWKRPVADVYVDEIWPDEKIEIPPLYLLHDTHGENTPYRSAALGWKDWRIEEGVAQRRDAFMDMSSSSSTISFISLPSSLGWKDYSFTALFDWGRAQSISLVARYNYLSPNNYVACSFAPNGTGAQLVQTIDEKANVISETFGLPGGRRYDTAWRDVALGITISGDTVECTHDGKVILKGVAPNVPATGGIAIETWERMPGNSTATLKEVSVQAQ